MCSIEFVFIVRERNRERQRGEGEEKKKVRGNKGKEEWGFSSPLT